MDFIVSIARALYSRLLALFPSAQGQRQWHEWPQYLWLVLLKEWRSLILKYTMDEFVIGHATEILIGVIALAVLILILLVWLLIHKIRGSAPAHPVSPKECVKAAKQAAKSKNFVRAGELYDKAGKYNKAVDMYSKGRAFTKAAEILTKEFNQPDKGLRLLLDNDMWEPAAKMMSAQGQFKEAAEHFFKAGKPIMAAEHFEKAGEHRRAGELFQKQHDHQRAAPCLAKAQMWLPAAQAYEIWFREFKKATANRNVEREQKQLLDLCRKSAYNYKQAGNLAKAAELCMDGGLKAAAAELFAQSGDLTRAANMYLEIKDLRKAAEYFHKSGDKRKAAELLAQLHQKAGNAREAAKYMEIAEEYLGAADIWAAEGQHEKAAALFLRGGDSRTAAEMYLAAGKPELAIQMYEELGDMDSAARLLDETGNQDLLAGLEEKRGRFYEAAMGYLDKGDKDKARELLEQVRSDHSKYGEAMARLGIMLIEEGKFPEALEKLQAMASRIPISPSSLDNYYNLGLAYEQTNHAMYAATVYQQIMAYNPHHRDTAFRLQAQAQKLTQQGGAYAQTQAGGSWSKGGGTIADRYRTIKELGRGGMGVVYLAEDLHLGRKVAFKVLPPELKHNKQIVEIFLREAKSLAKLSHPYIVSIFDAGEEQGIYYILMEFVEGKDLKQIMSGKRLPLAGGLKIFRQVCEALQYAHDLKIIHRDIKPANIMWTTANKIKIMDFGLAKVMDKVREGRTMVAGTPYYMSPEQTMGRDVDHRTDIYAMGVTVYELLTGRVPFADGDIGYHHLNTPPPPPRQFNSQIPSELELIILKCMAKNAGQRYQKAEDVLSDLERRVKL